MTRDNPMSPDLLSGLPLSIIHVILSSLPIRDAVRTSILARQWRYTWNTIPDLSFGNECVKNDSDTNRLVHVISHALLLHKGPIHKFQLGTSGTMEPIESQCMDQWLLFLSRNDIRILVLDVERDRYRYLHSSLYSCQYLTHLELKWSRIPPPPRSFKGFLCLRSLDLSMVHVYPPYIESIVALSPLLEKLMLDSCRTGKFTIRAPNLKYFHFNCLSGRLSVCTPLLEELIGDLACTWHFSIVAESFQGSSLVFRHLRIVKLSNVPFNHNVFYHNVTPAVIHLITSSPYLQKLEISGRSQDASDHACVSLWDSEYAPGFTYDSLKVIKLEGFGGVLDEMKIIRFLLARSPVLEKMMCNPHPSVPDKVLLNLMAELLSFRRASVNAEILIGEKRTAKF